MISGLSKFQVQKIMWFVCLGIKFIYSEKATKLDRYYKGQIYNSGDFAKFCGLLKIYELYDKLYFLNKSYLYAVA